MNHTTTMDIMRETVRGGSIRDASLVKRLVNEMADVPMKTLFANTCLEYAELYECLLTFRDLPGDLLDELSYLDILILINDLPMLNEVECFCCGYEDSGVRTAMDFVDYEVEFLKRLLFEASESNILVKQFLGLDVRVMLDYLDHGSKTDKRGVRNQMIRILERDFPKIYERIFNFDKGYCVRDFLEDIDNILSQSWKTWKDLDLYVKRMILARELLRKLLIESFCRTWQDQKDISSVLDKCHRLMKRE